MMPAVDSELNLGGLRVRSIWAIGSLFVIAVLLAITIVLDGYQIALLGRIGSGGFVTDQEAAANDSRVQIIGILYLLAMIPAVVFFCLWIIRAHRNLWDHGVLGLEFTPGWAVGWWFVPFASLGKPYQAVRELWRASSVSAATGTQGDWQTRKVTPILGLYWTCWIVGNWIGTLAAISLFSGETTDELIAASWIDVVSSIFGLAAALMAVQLIRDITGNQYKNLRSPPSAVITPGTPVGGQSSATGAS